MRDAKGRFSKEFGIGDRVVGVNCVGDKIDTTIDGSDTSEPRWSTPHGWCYTAEIRLAKPAPQPKAEDDECEGCMTLVGKLGKAEEEIASLQSEIGSLKAKVERLAKSLHEEMALGASIESARLILLRKSMDAEAKLEDLASLLRAMNLLAQTPGEEPSFQDAMRHVLGIA